MNMDDLLDQIDEVLDSGLKIPGKRTVIDVDKVRTIIDDMRMTMPTEIKQAKGIVADRAEIISKAKNEADIIIRNAEERAKKLTGEQEIVQLAQAKASEIIASAQAKSRDMKHAAQDFVDDLMARADEGLTSNLADVRKTRAALKNHSN